MTKKWRIESYGVGDAHVFMGKEEISCLEATLRVVGCDIPTLELKLWPRDMSVELTQAVVQALRSHIYERYEHHGSEVAVDSALKGLHRAYCLCYECEKFIPTEREKNCPKAERLFQLCVEEDMVTPVWECPAFKEIECNSGQS